MITVQEVTEWDWPNHIYMLDDSQSKCLGYQVSGKMPVVFTTPIPFDKKGRKFKIVSQEKAKDTITVKGSKGSIYYITKDNGHYKCSCTGYKFHGNCKHIKGIENEHH